jgi:hypothetical protein
VVEVVVQASADGSYTAPVFVCNDPRNPPQIIILEPVHIALWFHLLDGTLVPVEVAVQLLPAGS